jgi:hypothetical protein
MVHGACCHALAFSLCLLPAAAAAALQEDTQRYWRSVLQAPPGSPGVVPQLTQVRQRCIRRHPSG